MSSADIQVFLPLAAVFGIVAALWALAVTLCREWVKKDLRAKGLRPIRVRWRPIASTGVCRFNVLYIDPWGRMHRARCWTHWHRPSVFWEASQAVDEC